MAHGVETANNLFTVIYPVSERFKKNAKINQTVNDGVAHSEI